MSSPHAAPHITADSQQSLKGTNALPELLRIGFGAEPSRPQRRIQEYSP
jgi:hypothetical protein